MDIAFSNCRLNFFLVLFSGRIGFDFGLYCSRMTNERGCSRLSSFKNVDLCSSLHLRDNLSFYVLVSNVEYSTFKILSVITTIADCCLYLEGPNQAGTIFSLSKRSVRKILKDVCGGKLVGLEWLYWLDLVGCQLHDLHVVKY